MTGGERGAGEHHRGDLREEPPLEHRRELDGRGADRGRARPHFGPRHVVLGAVDDARRDRGEAASRGAPPLRRLRMFGAASA